MRLFSLVKASADPKFSWRHGERRRAQPRISSGRPPDPRKAERRVIDVRVAKREIGFRSVIERRVKVSAARRSECSAVFIWTSLHRCGTLGLPETATERRYDF